MLSSNVYKGALTIYTLLLIVGCVLDDLRTKLSKLADALADAADVVRLVSEIAPDMRPGCGEAPGPAPPKSSPQGDMIVDRPDDAGDHDGPARRDRSGDMVVPDGVEGGSSKSKTADS